MSALRNAGRVLVTGGAGFIGANLAHRLAGEGCRVLVLDSFTRAGAELNLAWLQAAHPDRIEALRGNVRDEALVDRAVRSAEAVVHLAAQVAVTTSLADPMADFEINLRGTLNVLEAARACPVPPPVILASTNKVYGPLLGEEVLARDGMRWRPKSGLVAQGVDERTPLDLYSPYGCSKGAADQYVLDYARVFGLRTAVLRMSCIYGPRQFGTEDQGWVAHFMLAALKGEPMTIYGDGLQVRDLLFVDDAVDAYCRVLARIDRLAGRALNLGGGPMRAVSLLEMLGRIEELTGYRPQVSHEARRPGDQPWYVSDTRALTEATGWQPVVNLDDGLRRLEHWLLELLEVQTGGARERVAA